MFDDRRVVAFIPYGRESTVSILARYLLREWQSGLLDEVMLCMNTDEGQESDVAYAHHLADTWPDLFKLYARPGPDTPELDIPSDWRRGCREPKQLNTGRFFVYMQDPNAVYVRFDDDIVWLHEDALETLVRAKLGEHRSRIAVFPVIWNNAICSWMLQKNGHIPPEWGTVKPIAVDKVGWGSPEFAEKLHGLLLDHIEHDHVHMAFCPDEVLGRKTQFSVSCFAILGEEYARLHGILNHDEEEHWLTQHYTQQTGRNNVICGRSMVAHLTFFTQRDHILKHTDIADRYRELATDVFDPNRKKIRVQ